MRRCRGRGAHKLGAVLLALGILIILALVMPPGFWLFALGGVLVCGGLAMLRR